MSIIGTLFIFILLVNASENTSDIMFMNLPDWIKCSVTQITIMYRTIVKLGKAMPDIQPLVHGIFALVANLYGIIQ